MATAPLIGTLRDAGTEPDAIVGAVRKSSSAPDFGNVGDDAEPEFPGEGTVTEPKPVTFTNCPAAL